MLSSDLLWDEDEPPQDSVIARVRRAIAAPEIKLVSFDCFDTLVKRGVEYPSEAFLTVGEKLAELGMLAPYWTPTAFRRQRMLAERNARIAKREAEGHPEATLHDIYTALHRQIGLNGPIEKAVEVELEIEAATIYPSELAFELLNYALSLKRQVIVVSDTYFSEADLRRFAPIPDEVEVFCSSAHGAGKGGDLFGRILERLEVQPHEVVHIGDNYQADVERPASYGIGAPHFPNGSHILDEIRRRERNLLPFSSSANAATASRLAARMAALRQEALLNADGVDTAYAVGASVFGPIFHLYLSWVRSVWTTMDRPIVVGLLRGGGFLAQLATELFPDMETRCLWTSRLAIAKARLAEPSVETIIRTLPHHNALPFTTFATRLGLSPEDFPEAFRDLHLSLGHQAVVRAAAEQILQTPRMRDAVAGVGKEAALRLQRHLATVFEGVGTKRGGRSALLLDHGWAGLTVASLVNDWGVPKERLHALFLGLNNGGAETIAKGVRMAGFVFSDVADHRLAELALRHVEIVEQIGTIDCGSVQGYTEDGTPELGADLIPTLQRKQRGDLRRGIRDYCRLAQARLGATALHDADMRAVAQTILIRACLDPLPHERAIYSGWVHDDSVAGGAIDALVPENYARLLNYMTPKQLLSDKLPGGYWILGAPEPAAEQGVRLALAEALFGDEEEFGSFESGLSISLLSADEPDAVETPLAPMRLNGRGYGLIVWRPNLPLQRVVLNLESAGPAMIRLERLMMTEFPVREGGRRALTLDAEALLPHCRWSGLDDAGAAVLDYRAVKGTASLIIDLPESMKAMTDAVFALGIHVMQPSAAAQLAQRTPTRVDANSGDWRCAYTTICGVRSKDAEGDETVLQPHVTLGRFTGWCFDNRRNCGPDSAELVLANEKKEFVFPARLRVRPDLTSGFKRLIVGAAGCEAQADLLQLPPGVYDVRWRVKSYGAVIDLPATFTFALSQGREGVKVVVNRREKAPA